MRITRLLAGFCALLFIALGMSGSLISAQKSNEPFTLEQALSSPFPSELVAAPMGDRIAWAFDAEGKRNIWTADGPAYKARQLTQFNEDTGQELTELKFTHDGKWVVFVRGGGENSSGETPNPTSDPVGAQQQVLAVSVESGRVLPLSRGENPVISPTDHRVVFSKDGQLHIVEIAEGSEPHPFFAARGANSSPQWSPDGKKLTFTSSRGTHSLIGVLDLEKRSVHYLAPSIDRDETARWSPDGRRIAFLRRRNRGTERRPALGDAPQPWSIIVADVDAGTSKTVWQSGERVEDSPPRMADEFLLQWAAGERLVFSSEKDGWMHLYSVSANGGEALQLSSGACEFENATLTRDRREIVFSSNCGDIDRRHLWRVSVSEGKPKALTRGEGIEWAPVATAASSEIAYFSSDARRPGMLSVMSLEGGASKPIAEETLPATFPAAKLVAPQPVMFPSADGLSIHGQLFLPAGAKAGEKLPTVIFSHGGPMRQMLLGWHNMYYYHNAYGFNQYLASKGYAVLSVNYRLGVGYGRAFRQAKNGGGRGASEYQDIVAAANYLRARNDVDRSRIGLWGGSYGGFLTAMGLARNSDLFAVGVDIHGVHDWSVRFSEGGGADREVIRIAKESSPIASVEKWKSPALLIHGDDDRNVAFSQTVELVRRLRELKVEHEVIVYPDEIHDFLLHRHWLEIFHASAAFLDKHLKGAASRAQRVSKVDLLIRGGSVFDGSGKEAVRADVGVAGGRIVFVGDAAREGIEAAKTIDASGLIVAPGFIDPHTHAAEDLSAPNRKSNLAFLSQGVTTVVVGNDGRSPLPLGKALEHWGQGGIGTNVAALVGHGSVRGAVMGAADAQPTAEQMERMKQLVRQAMDDGAFGMSTGLYYAPGSFAKTEEVIELSKVVAEQGGVYDSHMRDESSYNIGLLDSIEEVIRIGREGRLPVHISHIKALGADIWGQSGKAIDLIERARAAGVEITANQYPYTASGTSVTASLVPRWAEDGGTSAMLGRLNDPVIRPKLIAEMERNLTRRGGPESLLITSAKDRQLVGRRLDAIAKSWGKTPIEAAIEIIKAGGAGVASFNMKEEDIENFMRRPWVMTGSDGSGGHPRKYGTYPRKIRNYVLDRHVILMARMIEASSAQVAETFKIKDRGRIAPGYFADIVAFDQKTIAERATYEQPELLCEGMKYVLVNGKIAVESGKYNGVLAGKVLRKTSPGE
jgi:N-acyl-D-aspartate/D-glutamate deacylase/dipeptidyl aminopeptidase/acylaminoacyl peptidase